MTAADAASLHAFVEGEVQGVGFRAFVQAHAQRLGLTGWVRNCINGEVEVLAEGPRSQLEALLEKLHSGPRIAYIHDVRVTWHPATGEFKAFNVRSTHT